MTDDQEPRTVEEFMDAYDKGVAELMANGIDEPADIVRRLCQELAERTAENGVRSNMGRSAILRDVFGDLEGLNTFVASVVATHLREVDAIRVVEQLSGVSEQVTEALVSIGFLEGMSYGAAIQRESQATPVN